MKFLVALSCLLALAAAKPGVISYGAAPLLAPHGFSYSSLVAGHQFAAPLAYAAAPIAHHAVAAAPIAHHAIAAAPVAVAAPISAVEKTQYHAQDELGQASYGHSEAFQAHNAIQDAAGNKVGSWSYVAPDGQVISASYVADALGYRVASNALPVGPSALPIGPADTPEVVAARAAHLHEHAVAKSRSRRGIAIAAPLAYSAPLSHLAYSAPVVHHAAVYHPSTLTTVVNTPGHAVSYRID